MSHVAIVLCPPLFLTIDGILSKHVVLVNRYPVSWVLSHILNLPFQISNPHDRGGGGYNSNSGTGECRMVVTYYENRIE